MMKVKTLERLIWVLIYGGLLTLVVGIAVNRSDRNMSVALILLGALIAALGFIGIGFRSKLNDDESPIKGYADGYKSHDQQDGH